MRQSGYDPARNIRLHRVEQFHGFNKRQRVALGDDIADGNKGRRCRTRRSKETPGKRSFYSVRSDVRSNCRVARCHGEKRCRSAGFPIAPRLQERLDTAQFTSLYAAFEKLGLKMESKKLPQPVIVIDSVLKLPTEN